MECTTVSHNMSNQNLASHAKEGFKHKTKHQRVWTVKNKRGKSPISSAELTNTDASHRRIAAEKDTPESFVNRKRSVGKMPRPNKRQTKQFGNLAFLDVGLLSVNRVKLRLTR